MNIAVQAMHVPALVCGDYSDKELGASYNPVVAVALAQALGVEEFLFKPERIHELRRLLWEQGNTGIETLAATANS